MDRLVSRLCGQIIVLVIVVVCPTRYSVDADDSGNPVIIVVNTRHMARVDRRTNTITLSLSLSRCISDSLWMSLCPQTSCVTGDSVDIAILVFVWPAWCMESYRPTVYSEYTMFSSLPDESLTNIWRHAASLQLYLYYYINLRLVIFSSLPCFHHCCNMYTCSKSSGNRRNDVKIRNSTVDQWTMAVIFSTWALLSSGSGNREKICTWNL